MSDSESWQEWALAWGLYLRDLEAGLIVEGES